MTTAEHRYVIQQRGAYITDWIDVAYADDPKDAEYIAGRLRGSEGVRKNTSRRSEPTGMTFRVVDLEATDDQG